MEGLLLVDKPEGWTSFDVVAYIRKKITRMVCNEHERRGFCMESQIGDRASSGAKRINDTQTRAAQAPSADMASKPVSDSSSAAVQGWRCKCRVKVGHTGTLDPAATGLLVIAVGKKYTSQMPALMKQDKTYEVELTLGKTSSTGDKEGQITDRGLEIEDRRFSNIEIIKCLEGFVGEITQVPPAHSAVKVGGVRAYKLARAGKEVKIEPRKVTIYSISDIKVAMPMVRFTAQVSSGTYIRSLAVDIGEKLGCGAYMSNLRRTAIGDFSITDAIRVEELEEGKLQSYVLEKGKRKKEKGIAAGRQDERRTVNDERWGLQSYIWNKG